MRLLLFVALTISIGATLYAQQSKDTPPTMPEERIDVQKEFDEFGILRQFDSTYSYRYFFTDSNITGPGFDMQLDSIFRRFEPFLKEMDALSHDFDWPEGLFRPGDSSLDLPFSFQDMDKWSKEFDFDSFQPEGIEDFDEFMKEQMELLKKYFPDNSTPAKPSNPGMSPNLNAPDKKKEKNPKAEDI